MRADREATRIQECHLGAKTTTTLRIERRVANDKNPSLRSGCCQEEQHDSKMTSVGTLNVNTRKGEKAPVRDEPIRGIFWSRYPIGEESGISPDRVT